MKQAARNIAGARVDTSVRISSIRRQGGDGDVNLADVWPTITRVGARRVEPELEEGWRVRVAPPRDTRVAPLASTQESASERVRVAPPGSVRVAPPGRVRVAPRGNLDRPVIKKCRSVCQSSFLVSTQSERA